MPTLKGTEVSYVQCFLYLVSSPINVSIFLLHSWIISGQTSFPALSGWALNAVPCTVRGKQRDLTHTEEKTKLCWVLRILALDKTDLVAALRRVSCIPTGDVPNLYSLPIFLSSWLSTLLNLSIKMKYISIPC